LQCLRLRGWVDVCVVDLQSKRGAANHAGELLLLLLLLLLPP